MNEPLPMQQVDRTYVRWRGRKLSCFSGCDYFRMASHPKVLAAAETVIRRFGLNVAASRLTTGNHELYVQLERELARFFGVEMALLTPSGYLAASAVAQALTGTFSHVLLDERAHPALVDAAQFMDCPVLRFRHRDPSDLSRCVARCGRGARMIALTDGVFSVDGSVAPLRVCLEALPDDAMLLVDDAHGAGVIGRRGRGTTEAEGVDSERVIRCITLSKAFGAHGGAILGARWLRDRILEKSRILIGSTPIPLPLAGAALAAIGILKGDRSLRRKLVSNMEYVKAALRNAGVAFPDSPGPIIGIAVRSEKEMAGLRRRLLAADVYPPFVKYPGIAAPGFLRIAISSEHTKRQMDALIRGIVLPAKS